jgi:hypothetical protein
LNEFLASGDSRAPERLPGRADIRAEVGRFRAAPAADGSAAKVCREIARKSGHYVLVSRCPEP